MQFSAIIELIKSFLPSILVALFGWLLLGRLEEIKSEVARRSDFNQKWAGLFFDASNAFMVAVEHLMTSFVFLTDAAKPNDSQGMIHQHEVIETLPVILENLYRIQRLAALAAAKGPAAERAASDLFKNIQELIATKKGNVEELRRKIDSFNLTVREAHSEMISVSRNS